MRISSLSPRLWGWLFPPDSCKGRGKEGGQSSGKCSRVPGGLPALQPGGGGTRPSCSRAAPSPGRTPLQLRVCSCPRSRSAKIYISFLFLLPSHLENNENHYSYEARPGHSVTAGSERGPQAGTANMGHFLPVLGKVSLAGLIPFRSISRRPKARRCIPTHPRIRKSLKQNVGLRQIVVAGGNVRFSGRVCSKNSAWGINVGIET